MKKIFWAAFLFLLISLSSPLMGEETPCCGFAAGDTEMGGFRIFSGWILPDRLEGNPLPVYVEESNSGFFNFQLTNVGNADLERLEINGELFSAAEDNIIIFTSGDLNWGLNQLTVYTSVGSFYFSILLEKTKEGQKPQIKYY
ncbi:MAG: hypothetical protein WC570_03275 [Patescibacteria group bacterium]